MDKYITENGFEDVAEHLKSMPSLQTDADFTVRVMAAIHAEERRRWWMRGLTRTVLLPAAACAVAALAFASIFFSQMPPKPTLVAYARPTTSVRIAEYRSSEWFRPLNIAELAEPTATRLVLEAERRIASEDSIPRSIVSARTPER